MLAAINAFLSIALGLIPNIVKMVQAIELPGNGTDKAAVVVQFIAHAFDALPADAQKLVDATKIGAFAQKVISTLVGFFNKVGVFPPKSTTPPAA